MVKGINIVSNSILIPIDFLSLEFLLIDNRIYIKNWRRKLPSFMGRRTPFCTQAVSMLTLGCLRCYQEQRMRLYPTNLTTPPLLTEFASVKLRDCGINIGIWKVGNRDNHAHCDRYVKLMSELGLFENKSAWGPQFTTSSKSMVWSPHSSSTCGCLNTKFLKLFIQSLMVNLKLAECSNHISSKQHVLC